MSSTIFFKIQTHLLCVLKVFLPSNLMAQSLFLMFISEYIHSVFGRSLEYLYATGTVCMLCLGNNACLNCYHAITFLKFSDTCMTLIACVCVYPCVYQCIFYLLCPVYSALSCLYPYVCLCICAVCCYYFTEL